MREVIKKFLKERTKETVLIMILAYAAALMLLKEWEMSFEACSLILVISVLSYRNWIKHGR